MKMGLIVVGIVLIGLILLGCIFLTQQSKQDTQEEKVFGNIREGEIVYKNIDCIFEKEGKLYFYEDCE